MFTEYVGWDGYDTTVSTEFYQHDWLETGATVDFYGYTQIFDDRIDIVVGNTNTVRFEGASGFYYIFKDEVS